MKVNCTCSSCNIIHTTTLPSDISIIGGVLIKGFCNMCGKYFCDYARKLTEEDGL